MKFDSSRIIIVSGMPRAGTSVITYVLAKHKDITLYIDGTEAHVLENTLLPNWTGSEEQIELIQKILSKTKTKYILLKRPIHCINSKFIERDFPNALFVFMERELKEITTSWKNSGMVGKNIYENAEESHNRFKKKMRDMMVEKKIINSLEDFCENPQILLSKVSEITKLENIFNTDIVARNEKWTSKYHRELIENKKALVSMSKKTKIGLKGFKKEYKIDSSIIIEGDKDDLVG